jgi:ligand-binding sensor domain-containing protein
MEKCSLMYTVAVMVLFIHGARAQWVQTSGPLGGTAQVGFLAHNVDELFALTATGSLFLTSDYGTSWSALRLLCSSSSAFSMAVSGGNIYVGAENGICVSNDFGATWTKANISVLDIAYSILIRGSEIFTGTPYGVFSSTDGGANWSVTNSGMPNVTVRSLMDKGDTVFAGTTGGVFRSTDNCAHWTEADFGIPDIFQTRDIRALAVCNGNIFAASTGGVFFSSDDGTSWTSINGGVQTSYVLSFAVVNGNIFAGTLSDGVFLFSNSGKAWNDINTGLGNTRIMSLNVFGGFLFAGTDGGGVWRRPLSEMVGVIEPELQQGVARKSEFILKTSRTDRSTITIHFFLTLPGHVSINVFDLSGRRTASLVDKQLGVGQYYFSWDARNIPRACYIVKMQAGKQVIVKNTPVTR